MAQIFVFGRVMNDLVPKESQSKQSYVCFDLMERTKTGRSSIRCGPGMQMSPGSCNSRSKRQYDLACRLTAAGRCSA